MSNRYLIYAVLLLCLCGFRMNKPLTLSYPLEEKQIAEMNKMFLDMWNLLNGRIDRLDKLKIGDQTNYLEINNEGQVQLYGNAIYEKYMIIGAPSLTRVVGGTPPDVGTEGTFTTLLFATNQTEEVWFNVHVPADWDVGTDLEFAIYWAPTDGTDAKGVAWEFEWEAVSLGENLGAGSIEVELHDATQGTDNELLETGYGDISGASLAADDTIGIHLYRDHDDTFDDYASDAALIHIEIEYKADKPGEY